MIQIFLIILHFCNKVYWIKSEDLFLMVEAVLIWAHRNIAHQCSLDQTFENFYDKNLLADLDASAMIFEFLLNLKKH